MRASLLQRVLAVADCLFGLALLGLYGGTLLHTRVWPPTLEQRAVLLVAVSVLPIAALGLRCPLAAGIVQFGTAFIGNQLLHESTLPDLRALSSLSMALSGAILAAAVFRGIFEITQEAFGQAEDQDEKRATGAL